MQAFRYSNFSLGIVPVVTVWLLLSFSGVMADQNIPPKELEIARRLFVTAGGEVAKFIKIIDQFKADKNELYATDKLNELRAGILKLDPLFYGFKPKDFPLIGSMVLMTGMRHELESDAISLALRAVEVQSKYGEAKAKPYWAELDGQIQRLIELHDLMLSDCPELRPTP